ncbi:MAG: selenide, water dikinase SelD [Anaerohalosphaera sp.]|nr:selenide, water dikinase SelD [Anaerohalosphaera sp.]
MIDSERRKRVMKRSIKLGHCVCDPKKPCPCDLFREKNICLCAGERLPSPTGEVKLTKLIEKAGCASKIDQAFLKEVLGDLPMPVDANVIVGVPAGDDAGIYDIGNGTCLVQTVDVFTPTVDDPYTFGQIAAANSVSDVYAMGGKPMTALSVIGFPVRKIPDSALSEILRGGIDKMEEAGVSIIGGHSINDAEIKAGFAVTGTIDKSKVKTNDAAQVGDVLILTKPLGTGIISFASQIGRASKASMEASAASMTTLNKAAAELMVEFGAHAATDVTGFSLIGHLSEMVLRSLVDVEILWDSLPWLDGVLDYAAQSIMPGAIERNKESCGHAVVAGNGVSEMMVDICFDPQTSGGLLIAIESAKAKALLVRLHESGLVHAAFIGHVKSKGSGKIFVETDNTQQIPHIESIEDVSTETEDSSNSTDPDLSEGLDAYTKRAIHIALSVSSQSQSNLKTHIEMARTMGYNQVEIDEAAQIAIDIGDPSIEKFYKKFKAL